MTQLILIEDAPRWHDNPLLALAKPGDILLCRLPVGTSRQTSLLEQYRREFVQQLRQHLENVVLCEHADVDAVVAIAQQHQCQRIVLNEPVGWYEMQWLVQLQQQSAVEVATVDANSLLLDDLRPAIATVPPSYSQFRRQYEPALAVSPPTPYPPQWRGQCHDNVPVATPAQPRLRYDFGPITAAAAPHDEQGWRAHIQTYLHSAMDQYKQRRNGLFGTDFASFFSTPLALGVVGARDIYQQISLFEHQHGETPSSQWLKYELWWREYFRWVFRQQGRRCFIGLKRHAPLPQVEPAQQALRLAAWQQGRTGVPLVDANMRLLAQTGLMSNRGRQLVASYLVFDLGVDWRLGAAWFEQQLLDYDVASNYGNWAYISGALFSPARWFNQLKQAAEYDPDGDFVAALLPELVGDKPAGLTRHQPYMAALGLPFDRRWYSYLSDVDPAVV